ncbi:hypothetical protein BH09DEP1_BH09DEP1_4080 [soil metagenome]
MQNKSLILTLCLLTLGNPKLMQAMESSQNPLVLSVPKTAIIGGILGAGMGLIAHLWKQSSNKKTVWQNIKSCPWHYLAIPGVIGAAGAGYAASFFSSEAYYDSGIRDAIKLSDDVVLNERIARCLGLSISPSKCISEKVSPTTYDSFQPRFEKVAKWLDLVSHTDDIYPGVAAMHRVQLKWLKSSFEKAAQEIQKRGSHLVRYER